MNKRTKIFGAPGTGKTTKLISIITESGIPVSRIAYCTFGKKALGDMVYRMEQKGYSEHSLPYFKTIHAMNFKLLKIKREQIADQHLEKFCKDKRVKLTFKKKYSNEIFYADDEIALNTETIEDAFYNQMQKDRTELRPFNYVPIKLRNYSGEYLKFKHKYFDWLKENDYIDFIGMIEKGIAERICPPVDMICVDEWQDLNPLQIKQVTMWSEVVPISYHAGDDDQTIFEFTGADPSSFLNFACDEEIVLGETFRLPKNILALSNKVIARNKNRKHKDIHAGKSPGGIYRMSLPKLCDFLASVPPKESTYILIRNNFITIPLMADLSEAGIPLAGMHEEKSAVHLMQTGYEKNSFKYHEISTLVNNSIFPAVKYFTPRAKGKLKKLLGSSLAIPEEGFTLDEMKGFGMTDLFFRDLKKKDCTNLKIEPSKFKYIMKLIEKYGYSANPVHIVTIHQFKGMEADNIVIVPDITKTCYENENARGYNEKAVEAERRVWYTAVTRARKNLILLDRTTYSNYKSRIYNVISDCVTHSA